MKSHQPWGEANSPSSLIGSSVKSSCFNTAGHKSSAVTRSPLASKYSSTKGAKSAV